MSDARLIDFTYPGEDQPAGVFERGLSQDLVAIVDALADSVRVGLDISPGQRRDCMYTCAAWERALRACGTEVQLRGGVGVDDEAFVGYRLVPLDRRSGYREADDEVHRHFWLEIGGDHLIFDPTAHQFDERGGVSLDRYTVNGEPLRPVTGAR
jgi:hypothetical protein